MINKDTKIQSTNNTWNPWHLCKKVSAGCNLCYSYHAGNPNGKTAKKVKRSNIENFYQPLRWLNPEIIEVCTLSDFFTPVANPWRNEAWEIMEKAKRHQFQILTTYPERIKECLPEDWEKNGYPHVWLGVSIDNNEVAKNRITLLKELPAAIRFLSMEPLLGPIVFQKGDLEGIHWVIIGGESGNEKGKYLYRPCELKWITSITEQCNEAGVSFFVKQTGLNFPRV
jgi:protein gp37